MPKYTILTSSICTTRYEIEAENAEEAEENYLDAADTEEFINFANEYVTDVIEEEE